MSHVDGQLDDWVDGALSEADRAAVERHLAGCDRCRREADGLRALVAAARALPKEATPSRDLWPEVRDRVEARPAPRPVWAYAGALGAGALLAALCAGLVGVSVVVESMEARGVAVEEAQALLANGDLPGAAARLDALATTGDPEAVEAAAYTALLAGDHARADLLLASLAPSPEVSLRRCVVAQAAGDLDAVAAHGEASGLAPGLVLAAEVRLADAEAEAAKALLDRASAQGGAAGETARRYLALLASVDPPTRALAEATALWAVGQRQVAAQVAGDVVPALPEGDRRDAELLLWAGRAATSGEPGVAEGLLDAITAPPAGQAWRIVATRGLIAAARGSSDEAAETFAALEAAGAPPGGVADARATAAALATDPEAAARLAGGQRSVAAARALEAAGATYAGVAPDGSAYARYLGAR